MICLLELQCENGLDKAGDVNLHYALDDLHMTWAAMQIGHLAVLDRMPLTDIEVGALHIIWATMHLCQVVF